MGSADLLTGCTPVPCGNGDRVVAFPIVSPILKWLGGEASKAVGDVWKAAMIGLWSAGLWLLQLAFKIIDAFTTPDLSPDGPMSSVLPTTMWIGASVAALMMFVQLMVALVRRDGQTLGRVFMGIAQFGLVWLGYLAMAVGLVAAAAGLERGILSTMLHVDGFTGFSASNSWPRNVGDATLATVLGVLSLLLVVPASFVYVIIMFVREAALIILVATAPISAAGLVNDTSKVWFWKTLRWFFACLLISPTTALILGIGVQLSSGVVSGKGDKTAAAAGMAVVGVVMIAVGACCPLVLFRLLAFVEPGTASGAALRQSWSEAGGMSGLLSGGTQPAGGAAALASGEDGRSGGEASAESQTQSRLGAMTGGFGQVMHGATSLAQRAVDLGTEVLGAAGVGHPGNTMTPTDTKADNGAGRAAARPPAGGDETTPDSGTTGSPTPPVPPTPPTPPTPPIPGGGGGSPPLPGAAGLGGGGAAGAGAGGVEAAAAAVAL